ncbi:MAG: NADH-quinone oxidoreductase subunit NuoK [Myxococcales bacterium]|nr:NADH-quinone oxidoreductase subunit NuoK [Myxococcales bacterium]
MIAVNAEVLQLLLLLSAALFSLGVYGVLTRKNIIGLLIGLELMANAVNINLVAFARHQGGTAGQVFTLFTIALTVAEVAVGLALVILLHRSRRSTETDAAAQLHG